MFSFCLELIASFIVSSILFAIDKIKHTNCNYTRKFLKKRQSLRFDNRSIREPSVFIHLSKKSSEHVIKHRNSFTSQNQQSDSLSVCSEIF